jgi:hypothetical protein
VVPSQPVLICCDERGRDARRHCQRGHTNTHTHTPTHTRTHTSTPNTTRCDSRPCSPRSLVTLTVYLFQETDSDKTLPWRHPNVSSSINGVTHTHTHTQSAHKAHTALVLHLPFTLSGGFIWLSSRFYQLSLSHRIRQTGE